MANASFFIAFTSKTNYRYCNSAKAGNVPDARNFF